MCLEQQLSRNQFPAVFLDSWAATKAEKACSARISDEVARLPEKFDETPAMLQNSVELLRRHLSNSVELSWSESLDSVEYEAVVILPALKKKSRVCKNRSEKSQRTLLTVWYQS